MCGIIDVALHHPILNTFFEIFTWNYFIKFQWLPIEWVPFVTIWKDSKHYAQPKLRYMSYLPQLTKCDFKVNFKENVTLTQK